MVSLNSGSITSEPVTLSKLCTPLSLENELTPQSLKGRNRRKGHDKPTGGLAVSRVLRALQTCFT